MNYWIEMYWPIETSRKRGGFYEMWINTRKRATHRNIASGDIVFFYETQWKGRNRSVKGAMRIFAAGLVTNDFDPVERQYRNMDGKKWVQWRYAKILAWVRPDKGIPREIFNPIILKPKNFIMRYAPYKIKTPEAGKKLLEILGALDKEHWESVGKADIQSQIERESVLAQAAASGNVNALTPAEKEGLRRLKKSWVIERSANNRRLARQKWGSKCSCEVCGMNFDDVYGEDVANGYIEFHHLRPLAAGAYIPNPLRDIVPVCSNCHSMMHRRRPDPFTVADIKRRLLLGMRKRPHRRSIENNR